MTRQQLIKEIERTAALCSTAGMNVHINESMPWVNVHLGYDRWGDAINYFFQGEEASELLAECPPYVSEEDYILWIAQGW
jgi:hypothetical protein